jgi:hypothetical protein
MIFIFGAERRSWSTQDSVAEDKVRVPIGHGTVANGDTNFILGSAVVTLGWFSSGRG